MQNSSYRSGRLVRYVRRLIDDTAEKDGEDIVQDVALSLLARTDVLVPIESLSAYVYQSLRNRVIDSLRSRRPFVPYDDVGRGRERGVHRVHASGRGSRFR